MNFRWLKKWCVLNRWNIFYCRPFLSRRAAIRFLKKKHRKFKGYFVDRSIVWDSF